MTVFLEEKNNNLLSCFKNLENIAYFVRNQLRGVKNQSDFILGENLEPREDVRIKSSIFDRIIKKIYFS